MATHPSSLAWKIPWMEEPGGLQSMGSQRVGYDWVTSLSLLSLSPRDDSSVHRTNLVVVDVFHGYLILTCYPLIKASAGLGDHYYPNRALLEQNSWSYVVASPTAVLQWRFWCPRMPHLPGVLGLNKSHLPRLTLYILAWALKQLHL